MNRCKELQRLHLDKHVHVTSVTVNQGEMQGPEKVVLLSVPIPTQSRDSYPAAAPSFAETEPAQTER